MEAAKELFMQALARIQEGVQKVEAGSLDEGLKDIASGFVHIAAPKAQKYFAEALTRQFGHRAKPAPYQDIECPSCAYDTRWYLSDSFSMEIGEIIDCENDDCGQELEVTGLKPITVKIHVERDEDD